MAMEWLGRSPVTPTQNGFQNDLAEPCGRGVDWVIAALKSQPAVRPNFDRTGAGDLRQSATFCKSIAPFQSQTNGRLPRQDRSTRSEFENAIDRVETTATSHSSAMTMAVPACNDHSSTDLPVPEFYVYGFFTTA